MNREKGILGDWVDSNGYKIDISQFDGTYEVFQVGKHGLLPKCGAKRKNQSIDCRCTLKAGTRTNHLGTGRCYKHGGNAGVKAGKGIQNNLKHGAYVDIRKAKFTIEEQEYIDNYQFDNRKELLTNIKQVNVMIARHLDDRDRWMGELLLLSLTENSSKRDLFRITELNEWIAKLDEQITKKYEMNNKTIVDLQTKFSDVTDDDSSVILSNQAVILDALGDRIGKIKE